MSRGKVKKCIVEILTGWPSLTDSEVKRNVFDIFTVSDNYWKVMSSGIATLVGEKRSVFPPGRRPVEIEIVGRQPR